MEQFKDILIIDDEEVILDAVKKITKFENMSSDCCLNVTDALELLDKKQYKLIVCDIMMPEIDGFGLLKHVRQKHLSTPVVITTGYSTLENAVKALYEGAIGFIPKPFSIEELTSMIKRGIEYGKIYHKKNACSIFEQEASIDFIPCPPKYHRLGFDSWMSVAEEGLVKMGLTDLFLKSVGMIKLIEFMNIEETLFQGGNCLRVIDSHDYVHQLLAPISGNIVDINEKLIIHNNLIEKDPYFKGWIYKIIPSNLEHELESLTPCSSDI